MSQFDFGGDKRFQAPHEHALDQHVEDLNAFGCREFVHVFDIETEVSIGKYYLQLGIGSGLE